MRPLKIISVHNRYLQPGGEDQVFESEARLLTKCGHQVTQVQEQTTYPDGVVKKLGVAVDCIWSRKWHREFRQMLQTSQPDVVHIHNFFPLISPSVYYACRREGVPVVQTLHNYRLICASAELYRDGKVCEECLHHGLWRGVRYGCYQGSKPGTAALSLMLGVHRRLRTWNNLVDCYIALTEFARNKMIDGGLPADRIRVKPNFVLPDPGSREEGSREEGLREEASRESGSKQVGSKEGSAGYALFVGRLVKAKGVLSMLKAWEHMPRHIPLMIAGDGPCREQLELELKGGKLPSVTYLGRLSRPDTLARMKGARFLVFPSEWYEGFPVTIAESFACGIPVICSRLGSMQEIVTDGLTGLHFQAGDAEDMAKKVQWAWEHPQEIDTMGRLARREFETKYTASRNIEMLEEIYEFAIASRNKTMDLAEPQVLQV
jgi:glycosyltransferase involved in cell wall biosynthesis